jgi:pilus assembly protein CpaC
MKGNSALEGVVVQSVNGRMLLTGVVPDSVAMQHAMTLAKQLSIEDEITNAMRVAAPQQVMLEVRFIEASRSAAKALGVGAQVSSNNFLGATDSSLVGSLSPFGAAIGAIISGDTQVNVTLEALEERGLARRLAEPNLVALSGDTASFLAGGEFPFPVSSKDDQITVEFKKFGVGLAFTPTVLNDGQINLKIEPEVSNLDPNNSIRINNTEIPSLTVRRASTTVELRDGQSFAIAGLLQANHIRSARQLPWIGDVPILGALLRSAAWEKEETDLVIIITPRLVKPRAPGGKLATPLDKRIPTNEKEYFLTGRDEVNIGEPDDYTGHILELTVEEPVEHSWKGSIQ